MSFHPTSFTGGVPVPNLEGIEIAGRTVEKMLHGDGQFPALQDKLRVGEGSFLPPIKASAIFKNWYLGFLFCKHEVILFGILIPRFCSYVFTQTRETKMLKLALLISRHRIQIGKPINEVGVRR